MNNDSEKLIKKDLKKSFLHYLLLFVIIIYSLLFIHLNKVNAQQVSLAISPPLIHTVIKPGKSIIIAYKIQNFGDPVILTAQVLPFEAKDNLGNIKIKEEFEGPIRFYLDNADLQFKQPFFLKTGHSQQLLLRIRVPDGAPEGDYYYTLLTQTQPPPTKEGVAASRATAVVGSNILLTVTENGMVDVKGKVALFEVLSRFTFNFLGKKIRIFDSNDKIPIVLIVENKGENLFTSEGEIIVKGNFGEKAHFKILPQNVLSHSQRLMIATPSAEIDCQAAPRSAGCLTPVSLILSGFFLGLYKLSSDIGFGEVSPHIFASTSFIAFPFKLIFGFFLATFIGVLIIKKIERR